MGVGIDEVLEYINGVPDAAVYAIVNDDTKDVYIMHSTKFKTKFGELAQLLEKVGGRVEFFSISDHPVYKLIMAEKRRAEYINKGYRVTNQVSPFIKFTPSLRVDVDMRNVLVYVTSSRGLREVVGVFKSMVAAEAFKAEFYGESWGGDPVYAVNNETAQYWNNVLYKRMYGSRAEQCLVESNEVTQTIEISNNTRNNTNS